MHSSSWSNTASNFPGHRDICLSIAVLDNAQEAPCLSHGKSYMCIIKFCLTACMQNASILAKTATKAISRASSASELADLVVEWASALDMVGVSAAFKRLTVFYCSPAEKTHLLTMLTRLTLERLSTSVSSTDLHATALILRYCAQLRYYHAPLISACYAACVRWKRLANDVSLATVLYAISAMFLARRGDVPGVAPKLLQTSSREFVTVACAVLSSPSWQPSAFSVEQIANAAALLKLRLPQSELEQLLAAFAAGVKAPKFIPNGMPLRC